MAEDDEPDALPETPPPPGLRVTISGNRGRDSFKVIRNPTYLDTKQANNLIAAEEPVLGLVIGSEVRAYPTNQLNFHEMVIDRVGDVPVLVTS
jgi:hypothetical protein